MTGIADEGRQDQPDWADRADKATATPLDWHLGGWIVAPDAVRVGLGAAFQPPTLRTLRALKDAETSTAIAAALMMGIPRTDLAAEMPINAVAVSVKSAQSG